MKGIGIVFAGGGGKGAYEIGVWKFLHEVGLDQYIRGVSGTSVGALNAALFAGSSYDLAEKLWLNIEPEQILSPKKITPEEIIRWLTKNGIVLCTPLMKKVGVVGASTIMGGEKIASILLTRMKTDYWFSRDGLISLIKEGVDFNLLQEGKIPCYATCLRCPNMQVERFKLNDYGQQAVTQLLLASSAIPVVFPNEEFNGEKYCDGGLPFVGDNVPIQPIYDMGIENILVVHLNRETIIDKSQYPNSKIIEIVPSEDLGNALTGTLNFTSDGSSKRLQLGYADTKRILQPMLDMIGLTVESQMILRDAQQHTAEFEWKRNQLLNKEVAINEKMKNDGFDKMFMTLTKEK